jgi:flagellar motor switch protein FliN/FliY
VESNENNPAVVDGLEAEAMHPAEFRPLQAQPEGARPNPDRMSHLMKVDVEAQVSLGSALMKLNQVMELREGSIVTLDREVGENVDLMVNNQVFAQGQIVVVGDRYGLRILKLAEG